MPAPALGVIAALPAEAAAWRASCPAIARRITHCGLGPERARAAAQAAAREGVTALLAFGTAGALDPALRPGTLLLPRWVVTADGDRYPADPAWHAAAMTRLAALPPNSGTLLTSDTVIGTPAAKQDLWRRSGASAVDMESAAVAMVAAAHGLPFLALRAIVDAAQVALPAAALVAVRGDGGFAPGRFLRALVAAPSSIAELLRLRTCHRQAIDTLSRSAAILALEP